jgi:hypothetical protein
MILFYLTLVSGLASASTIIQASAQGEFENTTTNTDISPRFLEYENPEHAIKIQYPSTWFVSSNALSNFDDVVAFYSPLHNLTDQFNAKVTISIIPYLENVSFYEYTNMTLTSLNQLEAQDIFLHDNETDVIDGYDAYKLIYSSTQETTGLPNFTTMEAWTAAGNKLYFLTYEAEENDFRFYLPEVEHMIDTFQIG